MKFHLVFVVAAIALAWAAFYSGGIGVFWVRALGVLLGFFGFLLVFMLPDQLMDGMKSFGVDLIVIAAALLIMWV